MTKPNIPRGGTRKVDRILLGSLHVPVRDGWEPLSQRVGVLGCVHGQLSGESEAWEVDKCWSVCLLLLRYLWLGCSGVRGIPCS